jgi:hypothetical protein
MELNEFERKLEIGFISYIQKNKIEPTAIVLNEFLANEMVPKMFDDFVFIYLILNKMELKYRGCKFIRSKDIEPETIIFI